MTGTAKEYVVWVESPTTMSTRTIEVEASGLRHAHRLGTEQLRDDEFVRGVTEPEEERKS